MTGNVRRLRARLRRRVTGAAGQLSRGIRAGTRRRNELSAAKSSLLLQQTSRVNRYAHGTNDIID
jgi:hypothetical protein